MTDLAGQVALVAGAGKGIGRAIAVHLAGVDATVVGMSRTAEDLADLAAEIEGSGGAADPVPVDVSDGAAVRTAVERARARRGPIDLVVHAAGTAEVLGPFWETDLAAWEREVGGHLGGAAAIAHAVLPAMVERGQGRIVNVYGNLGDKGGGHCSAYACGKAGLLRFTEHVNAETEPHGVRLFALHPGLVSTPMTRGIAASEAGRRWFPRFSNIPDDRWGSPESAAEMIVSIAEGRLDGFAGMLIGAGEDLEARPPPDDEDERRLRLIPPGRP
jgi:NAD(P)-dependent dehydrogenase (short-subunit alcohol dehydrogenase family)